jgi:hypothetical protein
MNVRQIVPANGEADLGRTLAQLKRTWTPFASELVECCSALSTALMRDAEARVYPELQALAFWLRKSAVLRMRQDFMELASENCLLAPRGLVFHIPPSNVETISLYSWALAFLTGNSSVIRLSSRKSPQSGILIRLLQAVLEGPAADDLTGNTVILEYGHDAAVTAEISAAADVRITWGGDETIRRIRQAPLAPHAKDLGFADRTSLAVLRASAWLSLSESSRQQLAERFFNDTYWFNQMACSSPRVLVWCGESDECAAASCSFLPCLREQITRKNYALQTGAYLKKLAFAHGAILDNAAVREYSTYGNELTVVTLADLAGLCRQHCGGGLLYQVFLRNLDDLAEFIGRPDQTLATFGFNACALRDFAARLNGKGIDRIVPVGSALEFSRFWDGYDLLQELTRRVYICTAEFL